MTNQIINCRDTLAVTNHIVLAGDLNEHKTIYGGQILKMLDGTAAISAKRLARTDLVTASIDQTNFIEPFSLNDSLCIESFVSGVGTRSLEIFAKIIGEHLDTGERYLGFTSFLTFVTPAKDIVLPQIKPTTSEEVFICQGYKQRQEHRKLLRLQNKNFISNISLKKPWE